MADERRRQRLGQWSWNGDVVEDWTLAHTAEEKEQGRKPNISMLFRNRLISNVYLEVIKGGKQRRRRERRGQGRKKRSDKTAFLGLPRLSVAAVPNPNVCMYVCLSHPGDFDSLKLSS